MTQVLGTMRRIDERRGAVRVEDVYDTDIDDLWDAITDPARLRRWIAEVDGELRLGGAIHARFTSSWEGAGRIDVCDRPHRLLATMEPGTEDETVIEAQLIAEGDRTRLTVEERGLPADKLPAYGAGWQAHIEDLRTYLDGGGSDWMNRWTLLRSAYEAQDVR